MIDRVVSSIRRAVEGILPWYDPAERDERAERTTALHQRAIDARLSWERDLASYRRSRLQR